MIASKAISYLFLSYVTIIGVMEAGATHLFVQLLGGKYMMVTSQFNLLALAALFVPFYTLSSALLAMNKNALLLRYVIIASLCGMTVFCISGFTANSSIFPLGVVSYNGVLATLLITYVYRELQLSPLAFLRAAPDALRYMRQRLQKK